MQIFNSGAPSSPWTYRFVARCFALVPPDPSSTSGRTRGRTREDRTRKCKHIWLHFTCVRFCAVDFAAASRYWLTIASRS